MSNYIEVLPVDYHKINVEKLHRQTLSLLPITRRIIIDAIASMNTKVVPKYPKSNLPTNRHIFPEEGLNVVLSLLKDRAKKLSEKKGGKQVIVFLDSGGYMNGFLKEILVWIFSKEEYEKYVKEIKLPNGDEEDISAFNEICINQIDNDSIILFPGFNKCVHQIDGHFFGSHLSKVISNICNPFSTDNINNRLIAIGPGSQFVINVMGKSPIMSGNLITNIEGPIQLGYSPCNFNDTSFSNYIYKSIFSGISHRGNVRAFTGAFFRTCYPKIDLVSGESVGGLIPLIDEKHVGSMAAWGTSLGKAIGLNFHPEFDMSCVDSSFREFLEKLLESGRGNNSEIDVIIDNFDIISINSIGKNFYSFAILTFLDEILKNYKTKKNSIYYETRTKSSSDIAQHLKYLLIEVIGDVNIYNEGNIDRERLLKRMDRKGFLEIVGLDWKVNRTVEDIENILGINNLTDLIRFHYGKQQSIGEEGYIFRDMGAGNGGTINSIETELSDLDDIFVYGVGDRMYFDIYEGVKKSEFGKKLPKDIIILFCQKLVKSVLNEKGPTLMSKILNCIDSVVLHEGDYISVTSLTHNITTMFDDESRYEPDHGQMDYITKHYDVIRELIGDIKRNLYKYFIGDVEKVILSRFSDFSMKPEYSGVDFQLAVRSTSHIDDFEYRWVLYQRVRHSAKMGSIFIDNGVHRSYIGTPRINILHDLYKFFGSKLKIKLVYDSDSNYFTFAIIQVYPFIDDNILNRYISDHYTIVDIEEAYKCTYFKLEYFFRTFLITNFKDKKIFWEYNNNIIEIMKISTKLIIEGKNEDIKKTMVNSINRMVDDENVKRIRYNENEIKQKAVNYLEESTRFFLFVKNLKSVNCLISEDADIITTELSKIDNSDLLRNKIVNLYVFFRSQEYIEGIVESILLNDKIRYKHINLIRETTFKIFSIHNSGNESDFKKIIVDMIGKICQIEGCYVGDMTINDYFNLDVNREKFTLFIDSLNRILRISDDHLRFVFNKTTLKGEEEITNFDLVKLYIYFRIEEFLDYYIALILGNNEIVYKYSETIINYSIEIYGLFVNSKHEKVKSIVIELIYEIAIKENMYFEHISIADLSAFITFDGKGIDDILSEQLYPTLDEIGESWFNQNGTVRY